MYMYTCGCLHVYGAYTLVCACKSMLNVHGVKTCMCLHVSFTSLHVCQALVNAVIGNVNYNLVRKL